MSENATESGPRRPWSRPIPPGRGDEAALFLEHQRFLLRVTARRFGGSQELAEDACAFAWLQLLRCQPDRGAVVGWLRVVARNEGHRLLRISRREPSLEDRPRPRHDAVSGEPLDWQELLPAPADTELAVEARELLRALAGLRWHQRAVLTMQLAGYSYKEIAARLGKTYTWVNRHLTEGRAELRRRRVRELEAAGFGLDQTARLLGLSTDDARRSMAPSAGRRARSRRPRESQAPAESGSSLGGDSRRRAA
jgi:RNA polymerase sigma factor (sigma-70 family)